jgi:hypothetical protein
VAAFYSNRPAHVTLVVVRNLDSPWRRMTLFSRIVQVRFP